MEWSYGVTTVNTRLKTTLPKTLASLKKAGFDKPRLFVDGHDDSKTIKHLFGLEATCHHPNLRTFGNWVTALWDIYVRNPHADRYALFQDDFVTCKNLRQYLEIAKFPDKGYLNLYTFPQNQAKCPAGHIGFYKSNQRGLGAVALIFTRPGIELLLGHQHMVQRPQHKTRGHKAIDGGIVDSFRKSGWAEYVHNPSLTQHIGRTSSMGNKTQPLAESFQGEDFDALSLLNQTTPLNLKSTPQPKRKVNPRWDRFLFQEAIELCNKELPIVEIGCIRDTRVIAARADGHSTIHWGKSGIKTITIDTDAAAIKKATNLTKQYKNVSLIHGDGFEFLANREEPIGLLYLDGPHPRKEDGTSFSLRCYDAAKHLLGQNSVLLIDDCDISPGKGDLVVPKALKDGFKLVKKDRQCLMVREDAPSDPIRRPISRSKNRLGLVGYNCSMGLGELNEQIATHMDVDTWLVKPHPRHKTKEPHPDCDTIICRGSENGKIDAWLDTVDTVLFCETPYYSNLPQKAKTKGKQVICIPMLEWTPRNIAGWMTHVDKWLCPTKQCFKALKKQGLPVELFEWPVDTDRFKFEQRTIADIFLYIQGHGGVGDRKGGKIIADVIAKRPDLPIRIISQSKEWGSEYTIPSPNNNVDLYKKHHGSVLLMPHRCDGIGLNALEASACGLPIISTNGNPWNEYPSINKINSQMSLKQVKRKVHWYSPNAEHLIQIMDNLIGSNISEESKQARAWAESRSWSNKVKIFDELFSS